MGISRLILHCRNCFLLSPITLFLFFGESLGEMSIVFNTTYSPPIKIAEDSEKVYSVPQNQIIKRPIVATLEIDGVRVTAERHGELASLPFTVESVDFDVYRKISGSVDQWKKDGGVLCQWKYGRGPESDDSKYVCGENERTTTLTKDLRVDNGALSLEGLFHYHSSIHNLPAKRVFKITVTLPNSTTVEKATNPVLVEIPAWTIQFSEEFPSKVVANNSFNISLKIVDINKNIVTSGLDSTAIVSLKISSEFQTQVKMTGPRLISGDGGVTIEKRASTGEVTFSNIKILDAHPVLKFIATLMKPEDTWVKSLNAYGQFHDGVRWWNQICRSRCCFFTKIQSHRGIKGKGQHCF
ncbi:uncharacterized protein LOC121390778 [Gigantopelta aegis]|uniref:uncharacterized protein LOC121390778 n=1 Tax=Gigantopelta aegis TaxID=1735272 RepID=UPI001B888777|nr:uncharacterized protein LOC121390778 [Gigantopelta aegis]